MDAQSAGNLNRKWETDWSALAVIHVVVSQGMLHLVWGKPIVSQMGNNELDPVIEDGRGMNQYVFLYQLQREILKF